jgi:2-methylcitrate dehydratase
MNRVGTLVGHLQPNPTANMSAKRQKVEGKLDEANQIFLPKDSNQALGIAQFSLDFMAGKLGKGPSAAVLKRVELFHTDSVVCGLSALSLRCNAPTVLRNEALDYKTNTGSATVFGSSEKVFPEKAILANASAVREWDSNGTVFGYNKAFGHTAGEFGHNDFYPVAVAACEMKGLDGSALLQSMILLDEIRGRLAEVFSLKSYKIDHVVHGAIASAATYGALMGATAKQIEYAIGMVVCHYIPFRSIRAGHQLSDSKGASAAISTEVAIIAMKRAMNGFLGPQDIFRNPEAIFRLNEPTDDGSSPFNIVLSHSGDDFALMGMHFKLGLYEHQSAGALQGVLNLVQKHPELLTSKSIQTIKVVAYQPAFGIIGDPAKRDPHTRQSADHSMVYIVSRLLKKASELMQTGAWKPSSDNQSNDGLWKKLILTPSDYSAAALQDARTRELMSKIVFEHGGKKYDDHYPDGIPTSVVITDTEGKSYDSGFVMYPSGHARNTTCDLEGILQNKFATLGALAVVDVPALLAKLSNLPSKSAKDIASLYNVDMIWHDCVGAY